MERKSLSASALARLPRALSLRGFRCLLLMFPGIFWNPVSLAAQDEPRVIDLTMEQMVDLTMSSSYSIRRINLEIERDQQNLRAERARLKSRVDLSLTVPAFRLTSEPKWNSDLQKNQIIQEHTRRWEGSLSIRQPVILFGYPTNGYLSINNRMYRYNQIDDDGSADVSYYNRYFISYTQPLFQPNSLKNSIEQAELRLESTQLNFQRDIVNLVSSVSEGFHSILEQYYRRDVRQNLVSDLERALSIAQNLAVTDSARIIEVDQIQVELANAVEQLQSSESTIRLTNAFVRREYGLSEADSLHFDPVFDLDPVPIDLEAATRYAVDLTPRIRQMDIDLRNSEIRLERTRSRGGFRLNLNMTYGREVRDDLFRHLWREPENSYTINVSAFLPVWDWGEREARIASGEIGIQQTRLRMEQTGLEIVSGVRNEVLNVQDRESRTMAMLENRELAREVARASFQRYADGTISALDLLLNLRREADTAENFLEAYVSWKRSLSRLQQQTYFSFERRQPVLEWFQEEGWVSEDGFQGRLP